MQSYDVILSIFSEVNDRAPCLLASSKFCLLNIDIKTQNPDKQLSSQLRLM